jgi:putative methionine-R-sulfoxide reductase with GAF domain
LICHVDYCQNMTLADEELLRELQDFALTAPTAKSVMEHIAQHLHEKMARYNWVGFYLVDPSAPGVLLVGPFVGSFTPMLAFLSTQDFAVPQPAAGRS